MIALVLRNDPARAAATTLALTDMGFQVICVDNLRAADAIVRGCVIDVVICDEAMERGLTHGVLLSVERRHPQVCAFMLTEKSGAEADELFLLIPAIYALLPTDATIEMVTRFVRAGLRYAADTAHHAADLNETDDQPTIAYEDWSEIEHFEPVVDPEPNSLNPTPEPKAVVLGGFQSVRTPVFH